MARRRRRPARTGTSRATRRTSASRSRGTRASISTSGSMRRSATSAACRCCANAQGMNFDRLPRATTATPSCTTSSARTSSTSTACSGRRCCTARASARRRACTSTATSRSTARRCRSRAARSSWRAPTSTPDSTRKRCAITSRPSPAGGVDDVDLNLADFVARVNSDLVGKFVNLASRCAGFIEKRFDGRLADALPEPRDVRSASSTQLPADRRGLRAQRAGDRAAHGDGARRRGQPLHRRAQAVGARQAGRRATPNCRRCARRALNLFRVLAGMLKPVLPTRRGAGRSASSDAPVAQWHDLDDAAARPPHHAYAPLFTRIDPKQIDSHDRSQQGHPAARRAPPRTAAAAKAATHDAEAATRRRARAPSASTTSPGSTCASAKCSPANSSKARTSCCASSSTPASSASGRSSPASAPATANRSAGRPQGGVHRQPRAAQDALRHERRHDPVGRCRRRRLFLLDVDDGAQPGMPVK